jgi:predicted nuclease of predicted toxin-antitoxin system
VRDVGLESATDEQVWNFAAAGGFVLVSKDADFRQLSKVDRVAEFERDPEAALLVLA